MRFDVDGILLDIEGTTSSIHFVYHVMFPFVRRELVPFLEHHGEEPDVLTAVDLIAREAGYTSLEEWTERKGIAHGRVEHQRVKRTEHIVAEVLRLMDGDVKSTGLKQLQGMIWHQGFVSGELKAHVYSDVPAALKRWHKEGLDIRIYSSGSVHAQKLFFTHTEAGNLLPFFHGHYDTQIGSKRDAESYRRIVIDMGSEPGRILFISDIVAELDAARQAGLQTILCQRPENSPITEPIDHTSVRDFENLTSFA